MKRAAFVLAALFACLTAAGCLGPVQADNYAYVVAIGFDEGQQFKYEVSLLVQKEEGGDSQSARGGADVYAAEGDNLFDVVTVIHAGSPLRLNFSRVNTIVVGQGIARSGGLEEIFSLAFDHMKIRQSSKLVVSLPAAKSFLQGLCLEDAPNITKLQYSVFENYSGEGISPVTSYALFTENVRSGRSDPVIMLGGIDTEAIKSAEKENAEMTTGSNPGGQGGSSGGQGEGSGGQGEGSGGQSEGSGGQSEGAGGSSTEGIMRTGGMGPYIEGSALFDGWYMRGVINGNDTKYLLMARGEFVRGHINVPYGESDMTLRLTEMKKPEVKISMEDGPRASVHIAFTCEPLMRLKGGEAEWDESLGPVAEAFMAAEFARVFGVCQRLNSDAMGLGWHAAANFSDAREWEAYCWKSHYPELDVVFTTSLEIQDTDISVERW